MIKTLSFGVLSFFVCSSCTPQRDPASAPPVVSAWSGEEAAFVKSNFDNPFPDPFVASVWGSVQNKTFAISATRRLSVGMQGAVLWEIEDSSFSTGGIQGLLFLQKRTGVAAVPAPTCERETLPNVIQNKVKGAPLMVVLPGTFNNPADTQCRRFIDIFSSRGYHVLVIPNAMGDHYIGRRPKFAPGNLLNEAQVVLNAIRRVQALVGQSNITRVNMIGASYGGLLAVVTQNSDKENLINGTVTLLSPPINFLDSMNAFDKMIQGTSESKIKDHQLSIVKNYFLAKKQSDLPRSGYASIEAAPEVFGVLGFQDWLIVAAQTIHDHYGIGPVPDKNLKFTEFTNKYLSNSVLRLDQETFSKSLFDWVEENKKVGKSVRVMSAVDDVINPEPQRWRAERRAFSDENLLLLPSSGHLSMISYPWFERFMNLGYGNPRPVESVFDQMHVAELTDTTVISQQAVVGSELLLGMGLAFPIEMKALIDRVIETRLGMSDPKIKCAATLAKIGNPLQKLGFIKKVSKFGLTALKRSGAFILATDSVGRTYIVNSAEKDPGAGGTYQLVKSYLEGPGCLKIRN